MGHFVPAPDDLAQGGAGRPLSPSDRAKWTAAFGAAGFVEPGMVLGLGTGSTANFLIEILGARVREGLALAAVPTSEQTARLAMAAGIRLLDPELWGRIDLTIDGADEVDPAHRLIKGGGAALLREKIVAAASDRMIVIADATKRVDRLGRFPLPVEITPFGHTLTRRAVEAALRDSGVARVDAQLRKTAGGEALVTDGGNLILDCRCEAIPEPEALALGLSGIPGVVEHGLFIGLADGVVYGGQNGAHLEGEGDGLVAV